MKKINQINQNSPFRMDGLLDQDSYEFFPHHAWMIE